MSTIAERLSAVDTKLNNILTNANTQLTNKGKTAVSDLSDLPSAVGELKNPTGTKSITQNGTVDVSNYASANVNVPTPSPTLQSKSVTITENGTTTITADSGYDGLDEVEVTTNVSGGQSEYNAKIITTPIVSQYSGIVRFIKETPAVDISSLQTTSLSYMFSSAENLETVALFDTSRATDFSRMFNNCTKLINVPEFNTSNVTNLQLCFSGCDSLSNESLNNILAMCYKSAVTSNNNLQKIGLTSAQADICETLPNWSAYIAGGWAKGY